jgi:hypothetical protein
MSERRDVGRAEGVRRPDLRRAAERRAGWAEFYRAQIRAAKSVRERVVERLDRLLDDSAADRGPRP